MVELTLELLLFVLIAFYVLFASILAFVGSRKYLADHPDEEIGRAYFQNDERNNLAFAGFSLTALALLVGLQFNKIIPLSTTIQFFSLAFTLIIISYLFVRFRYMNVFVYLSDVLLNAGLLSIGCGFLVFFAKNVSPSDSSTVIFTILVLVLFIASFVNYFFFQKYTTRDIVRK